VTDVLGPPDFASHHHIEISAGPEEALAALRVVRGADLPVTRVLMGIRTFGRRRTADDVPVLEGLAAIGARPLSIAPRRLEYGVISQPWKLTGGERVRWDGAEEFAAFDRPGFVRVLVVFWAEALPGGGSRLSTATRIRATDRGTRRRFGRYWRVVAIGSGLIRREWLRAARRRATA
jgi:hypothetical protein